MSDDITEVGTFEPREYKGMFLTMRLMQRPDLHNSNHLGKLGIYDKYSTRKAEYYYLVDDSNEHFFIARDEFPEEENAKATQEQ